MRWDSLLNHPGSCPADGVHLTQILLDTLEGLDMHYPKTTPERHQELLSIREQLAS